MPALTVDQIMSDIVLGLASGLDDLLVLEFNGRRVLYGVSRAESRLVEIEVASDGQLSLSGSLNLSGSVLVGTSAGIEHGVLPGADALFLSGFSEADGQQVSLSATGTLGAQQSVSGVGLLSSPATLEVSGTPVLMASQTGGGLAHFAYTGGGYATGIGLEDASDRYLGDIAAIAPFVVAGTSYVATASATENGVNIASVTETGLTQTGALGAADSLPISTPSDLEVLHRLDETLIVVASVGTSSLSILDVENGVPALADHIYDSAATRFQGASSAATATYGDFAFVAAGGAEGGVSLLTVLPGGRLVHLDSVAEDETVPISMAHHSRRHGGMGGLSLLFHPPISLHQQCQLGGLVESDGKGLDPMGDPHPTHIFPQQPLPPRPPTLADPPTHPYRRFGRMRFHRRSTGDVNPPRTPSRFRPPPQKQRSQQLRGRSTPAQEQS